MYELSSLHYSDDVMDDEDDDIGVKDKKEGDRNAGINQLCCPNDGSHWLGIEEKSDDINTVSFLFLFQEIERKGKRRLSP